MDTRTVAVFALLFTDQNLAAAAAVAAMRSLKTGAGNNSANNHGSGGMTGSVINGNGSATSNGIATSGGTNNGGNVAATAMLQNKYVVVAIFFGKLSFSVLTYGLILLFYYMYF